MNFKKLFSFGLMALMCAVLISSLVGGASQTETRALKVGFIYIGPIGDLGWTHAHEQARLIAEETFPWLESIGVESVPIADAGAVIDRLIAEQNLDVVITTSFDFMDATVAAAQRHPDVIFVHVSGFKRAPNLLTMMADFHQLYYLNGLMAGALTAGKVGYMAAVPIPELKRHICAFTIGAKEVNPEAVVEVRWLESPDNPWFNPSLATQRTKALIQAGADVIAFTEDSAAVVTTSAENGVPVFGHYSPMHEFAPDYVVSGQLVHWEAIYNDILAKVYAGLYTPTNLENVDYWWLLAQGAVELGGEFGLPINPVFEDRLKAVTVQDSVLGQISVYDLIFKRLEQMSDPEVTFSPFTGPIFDRQGNLRAAPGERLGLQELTTMEWACEGIVGPWPGEPE